MKPSKKRLAWLQKMADQSKAMEKPKAPKDFWERMNDAAQSLKLTPPPGSHDTSEIAAKLGWSKSFAVRTLRILRQKGKVRTTKIGNAFYYEFIDAPPAPRN